MPGQVLTKKQSVIYDKPSQFLKPEAPKVGTSGGLAAPLDNRPEVCRRGWGHAFLEMQEVTARSHCAGWGLSGEKKERHGPSPGAGHTPGKVSD